MKQETVELINNFIETLDHSYKYKTKNERNLIREEIKNIVECEVKNLTIPVVNTNEANNERCQCGAHRYIDKDNKLRCSKCKQIHAE